MKADVFDNSWVSLPCLSSHTLSISRSRRRSSGLSIRLETFGGKSAVGHRPETGRQELLQLESKAAAAKEKEL